ncbi:MAG: hypothetical protein RL341_1539 [Pseudomonadota bacterium]|jgi:hypothetical protein
MNDPALLKTRIASAFSAARYPGDALLVNSQEGTEPALLEQEFKGKRDWHLLDAAFIDQAPDGFGSALSFFSHEAFRFYLPAYLIADLDQLLNRADPVFHLTHGLDNASCKKLINPLRYGRKTWFAYAQERFATFSREESAEIAAYLTFKRDADPSSVPGDHSINEALDRYWAARAR